MSKLDRRQVLAGGLAGAGLAWLPGRGLAGTQDARLRVTVLKFGSLNWLMDTIRARGLAQQSGVELDLIEVSTNAAGPLSLIAQGSDVIVSDWLWAMRQRSKGVPLKFAPYSSALGSVMVAPDSGIKTLADLKGRKIGVSGSPIDKSWLLLRAYSRKTLGEDVSRFAKPVFGSAPLIAEQLKIGRVDAVLNFWTFSARLSGHGFVPVLAMEDVLSELGISPVPALVGYVWNERIEETKGRALSAFFKAVEAGNGVLGKSDPAWEGLRKRMRAKSQREFIALRDGYRSGIPSGWGSKHTGSAEKLFDLFRELGKSKLVGAKTKFDGSLFRVAGA